jgi:hypothetical protein
MRALAPFRWIGHAAGVFGSEKSFVANPILGSPRLNRIGLHRARVSAAAALAARRRRTLAPRLDPTDREAFDRDGFVVKPDFLDPESFAALKEAVFGGPHPAREMRQGQTVTRMAPLSGAALAPARAVARRRDLADLMGYAAGRAGAPVMFLQTVIADPAKRGADPQTALHADTFHATGKLWLFLTDVGEEDGPFVFVPGSHRLTPERLDWERRQSLTARDDPRRHHALGSFRIAEDELAALGYGPPRRMTVKANTLVVADTFGFHRRSPSARPTTRVEIHGYLRRNPFIPWNGLDPAGLPGVAGRQLDLFFAWLDMRRRLLGAGSIWRDVGRVSVDGPASA